MAGHMTPDEFRRRGYQTIDWIARYLERLEEFPVMSRVKPGEVRAQLPPAAPDEGEPFEQVLADLERVILPGITHWQAPAFFAFFPASSSPPAILGDLLSSGLGVQGMLWATSPACTELETHLLDWLVEMLDLPRRFKSSVGGGVIQDSASSASLCALLAARERATGYRSNERGVREELTAYTSNQAHSSIEKAVMIAGIGREQLRLIDVDDAFAMDVAALAAAIESDLRAGRKPCFVSATVGTTSSNALDDLRGIGALCREHGIWLHVDGAMSGTAALCPRFRYIHEGLELADSYCFNPHKWMLTNFDCDCMFVADREPLVRALSVLPEYLKNEATQSGAVIDYRDWQVPLGRRFRALKLWLVIRHYGVEGLRAHVERQVGWAQELASWVDASDDFERMAPAPLNLVCFRHRRGDEFSERLLARLNESGKLYLTHTRLAGRYALRMAIGGTWTERRHVESAWRTIVEVASDLSR